MMTSSRPYLVDAVYRWIADNDMTPYLVAGADYPGIVVPPEYIDDGRIVLNVSMNAVRKLVMDHVAFSFDASFSGVVYNIYIPMDAVIAIYSKENGRGIVFDEEEESTGEITDGQTPAPPAGSPFESSKGAGVKSKKPTGKPNLTIVK